MTFIIRPLQWLVITSFIALTLIACQSSTQEPYQRQLMVFGTVVNINIWTDDVERAQAAVDEISEVFNAMHHQWHAWKPGRLSDINQALRSGESIELTTEEAQFIQTTINLSKQSNHLFNPTIGELINLWGFHTDDYPIMTPPPKDAEIKRLVNQNITVNHLILNNLTLSSEKQNIWLDMGGIAKGYATDVAVEILKAHDIDNAIINAGGDLRSMGNKGSTTKPWRVAIQSPSDWSMLAELTVQGDESIFTSGNYQRYKEFHGKRYAHIIDSRTGLPVDSIVSATVIAENGTLADAAATALVVAGDDWPSIAKKMNINQALIIDDMLQCFGTKKIISRLENLSIQCQSID